MALVKVLESLLGEVGEVASLVESLVRIFLRKPRVGM